MFGDSDVGVHLVTSQGDLIQGVLLFWDLYACGDWIFCTESLHGAIAVRTISSAHASAHKETLHASAHKETLLLK